MSNLLKFLGSRIAGRRKAIGFKSAEELADAAGLKATLIRAWEAGRNMPGIENLEKLAVALKVEPLELFQAQLPVRTEKLPHKPEKCVEVAHRLALKGLDPPVGMGLGDREPTEREITLVIEGILAVPNGAAALQRYIDDAMAVLAKKKA